MTCRVNRRLHLILLILIPQSIWFFFFQQMLLNYLFQLRFRSRAKECPSPLNVKYIFIMKACWNVCTARTSNDTRSDNSLTLKEPGFLDPSHSRGVDSAPKISETDWQNIKCVVLVDSYYPPESIGTKKSTNIPCMTPQWRHKWRHVKNTKITKNRQNHGFSLFFSSKSCILWQWCVSKYAYTCSILQINQINKIKHSENVSWNKKNTKNSICV